MPQFLIFTYYFESILHLVYRSLFYLNIAFFEYQRSILFHVSLFLFLFLLFVLSFFLYNFYFFHWQRLHFYFFFMLFKHFAYFLSYCIVKLACIIFARYRVVRSLDHMTKNILSKPIFNKFLIVLKQQLIDPLWLIYH